jgi:hypothetical protein
MVISSQPRRFNTLIFENFELNPNISQKQPIKAFALIVERRINGNSSFGAG